MNFKKQLFGLLVVFVLLSASPGYAAVFYHYTNQAGVNGIKQTGYIKQSTNPKYAHFGTGVYGTGLSPDHGKEAIAKNNYQNGWKANMNAGRVDFAFKFDLPSNRVKTFIPKGRNIMLYTGGNLTLSENPYTVEETPNDANVLFKSPGSFAAKFASYSPCIVINAFMVFTIIKMY
ncbi:uncharacterized protein LOC124280594 [Haliotis rubra]|uniref:uncharacterized protein LOC124280594 n=1 Tax=Haliotis rubra TaxID=36100 RepID=UPI001EE54978|nr:uncharacterized protein LOC124280594 [Haliotis rubra]